MKQLVVINEVPFKVDFEVMKLKIHANDFQSFQLILVYQLHDQMFIV